MSRKCDRCHQWYLRRNLVEGWVKQNPGHRDGWLKVREQICTHCQNAENAKTVVKVFHNALTPEKK